MPREPGTLCARGILLSDLTFDFVKTLLCRAEEDGWRQAKAAFDELETQAEDWLVTDDVPEDSREFRHYVEARYEGQSFEVRVEFDHSLDNVALNDFITAFHAEHKAQYSYDIPERIVEIVNCRLEAVGQTPKPPMESETSGTDEATSTRRVHFGANGGWQEAIVYERGNLITDKEIQGPAILEEMSSTTVVPPNYKATTDEVGNLTLEASK